MSYMSKLEWFERFHEFDTWTKKLLVELSNMSYNSRSYSKLLEIVGCEKFTFDTILHRLVTDGLVEVFNSHSTQNILMVALTQRLEITPTLMLVTCDGVPIDSQVVNIFDVDKVNKLIVKFFYKHRVLTRDEIEALNQHGHFRFEEDGHTFVFSTSVTTLKA